MISAHKIYVNGKIIENYQNKENLYLERAIRHDYFAGHHLLTNKGTKQ